VIFRPRNIRTRLTLWYTSVLGGVLLLYVFGTSAFLFFSLRHDLDENLIDHVERTESQLTFGPDGILRVASQDPDADAPPESREYLEVRALNGDVLYENQRLGANIVPEEGRVGYWQRSSKLSNGTRIRVASRQHQMGTRTVLLRVAITEEPFWKDVRQIVSAMLLGLPIALSVAALGGYGLARRVLAPLDQMAKQAERISAERLHDRLAVEDPDDELGSLARVFNQTLGRLESSFEQLRRFTADASHELRTPLTAIRSVGEVGLQNDGAAPYYREIIGSMLEEANRLTRLIDGLLTISRADSGQIKLSRTAISVLDVAREAATLLEVLAEEKNQTVHVTGNHELMVLADRTFLRQAVVNLLDNAVKYSPADVVIDTRIFQADNQAVLEVEDHGPGIPPEHQAHVFERFYRVDQARSNETGGAGLGLWIAKWAVEANGGAIELRSEGGRGCVFRISLPLAGAHRPGNALISV
jgi:heavy metal sensor kinase